MQVIAQFINGLTRKVPAWPLYILLALPGIAVFVGEIMSPSADPVEELEHELGEFAIQLLVVGMLVTPVRDLLGVNLIKYRRAIGVMAFVYVLAHFLVYLLLDAQLDWGVIWQDLSQRTYIIVGFISFLILIPLAATSNNWALRKMGPVRWRRLHYFVYPAVILGAVHYVMLEKVWDEEALMYLAIMIVLVGYRFWPKGVWPKRTRARA